MKFKALFLAAIAAVTFGFVACNSSKTETEPAPEAVYVDEVFACADSIIGDTLEVQGIVSHLCSHGGRKAFLLGVDTTLILRCEATAEMGGAFAPDTKGKHITVKGIFRENRIDEEAVAAMEARHAAADSVANAHEGCDTEKKALGQDGIDTFAERMADFRAKIAERDSLEGKPYLSNYYLEAIGYTVEEADGECE